MKNILKTSKTVCAIHDMSGIGRCSLSVIIPVMSALGTQVCPVPTAVLSSHTGGFGEVAISDLTAFLSQTLTHYKNIGIDFDCIYSGYLASHKQISVCLDYFNSFETALKVVDPVMGDHGKAYRMCTPKIQDGMKELVKKADIITPNLTECFILLGEKFKPSLSVGEVKSILSRLSQTGPRIVVITGVELISGGVSNFGFDRESSTYWQIDCSYVPVSYPGTGDIFCATLVANLLKNDSLPMAIEKATKFLETAINITYGYQTDTRHGVMLEKALPSLFNEYTKTSYRSI